MEIYCGSIGPTPEIELTYIYKYDVLHLIMQYHINPLHI